MDIRQIRLFCRIVERKSFSLAADEMRITQPAASQQVRSLEREFSTTLLDRSRRTVVPTDAGQVLYRYGRDILDLDERVRTEILDLGELVAGRVVVGASTGPGDNVLPAMLSEFKRAYPGVAISLHVDDTHTVIERVLSRGCEIGAVGAVTPRHDLVAEPLARDEIVLVCAPTHPWASRDQVTLDELIAEPHLIQQQGAGVRSVLEDHLRQVGVRPEDLNVVMEIGLMEAAKQAAIAGGGVTFLSRWAIGPDVDHGTLCVVPIEGFRVLRDFYSIRSRTRVLSRAAEALLAHFRQQYAAADQDILAEDEGAPTDRNEASGTMRPAPTRTARSPRKDAPCSSS